MRGLLSPQTHLPHQNNQSHHFGQMSCFISSVVTRFLLLSSFVMAPTLAVGRVMYNERPQCACRQTPSSDNARGMQGWIVLCFRPSGNPDGCLKCRVFHGETTTSRFSPTRNSTLTEFARTLTVSAVGKIDGCMAMNAAFFWRLR